MKNSLKEATSLAHKTVVIVGASSGIGRAAALAFAAENCNLVLASRRNAVLAELAVECESLGGKATHKVTDVTDAEAVKSLCEYAIATFGHIDVWINNAGAGVMGTYEEIPTEVHDQVVKVSLLGHMYGAHAVLPHFKERKKGTLINTISIGAFIPETYGVAYSASKYGLRGYSEALRAELGSWRDIHICNVFPSYIDTPGFEHAGNYTGKKLRPVPPVYTAERVARAMVKLAQHPKGGVIVGESGHMIRLFGALFPRTTRRSLTLMMDQYFSRAKPAPVTNGALFQPMTTGTGTSGGWRRPAENLAVNIAAGLLAAGIAAGIMMLGRKR